MRRAATSSSDSRPTDRGQHAIPGPRRLVARGRQPGARCAWLDLLLQLEQALEQRLGARRAAGDVHVDRHDLVDAVDDVVAVVEGSAAGRAGAHGDDPLGLGHLLVEALEHRRHLLVDGAGHDHEVALARRGPEDLHAVPSDVEAGKARAEHLDRAAGEAVGEREHGVRARPAEDEVDGGRDDVGLLEVAQIRVRHRAAALGRSRRSRPLERTLAPGVQQADHRARQ